MENENKGVFIIALVLVFSIIGAISAGEAGYLIAMGKFEQFVHLCVMSIVCVTSAAITAGYIASKV